LEPTGSVFGGSLQFVVVFEIREDVAFFDRLALFHKHFCQPTARVDAHFDNVVQRSDPSQRGDAVRDCGSLPSFRGREFLLSRLPNEHAATGSQNQDDDHEPTHTCESIKQVYQCMTQPPSTLIVWPVTC